MKKILFRFLFFILTPLLIILLIYLLDDPFKTLHSFSVKNCSTTNREYVSTELYLQNRNKYNYNTFVLGSSKCGGFNMYQIKSSIPNCSYPYLFQSWGETITGIYQKLHYLSEQNADLNNIIILLDLQGSFKAQQLPKTALGLKHYLLSGESELYFQCILFYSFIKPTKIYESVVNLFYPKSHSLQFDTITNEWDCNNRGLIEPKKNMNYDKKLFRSRPNSEMFSEKLISDEHKQILIDIKYLLDKERADYKIIIAPDYNQVHINKDDYFFLKSVFGDEKVFNFSGKNYLTEDKYNFLDINHFDKIVGWKIIEQVYPTKNQN
jgi:hypothetical protein